MSCARKNIVEIAESLERVPDGREVAREPVAGEDALGSERRAAVGVAVTGVDVGPAAREDSALAGLSAGGAHGLVAPERAPALRPRVEPVREHLECDALALEHRLDQLVEAAREDHRAPRLRELAEAGAQRHVLADPGDRL